MSSSVSELKSLLHDQPINPLRPNQVQDYQEEADRNHKIAQAPPWQGGDRGVAVRRHDQLQRMIREQAPHMIEEPLQRDRVAKLTSEVLTNVIQPALLTRAQMRRNPAGAVDAFIKREQSKPVKDAILTWKRAMRALDPENSDQDYTNIERFRAEGINPDGTSTFMVDAQIPGVFAMTPAAKQKWPLGEPHVKTPLAQAKKRELSEAQLAGLKKAQDARKAAVAARKAAATEVAPVEV